MVKDPKLDEEYEWRQEGLEAWRVLVMGVWQSGDGGVDYSKPINTTQSRTYPEPAQEGALFTTVEILSGPEQGNAADVLAAELYEIGE